MTKLLGRLLASTAIVATVAAGGVAVHASPASAAILCDGGSNYVWYTVYCDNGLGDVRFRARATCKRLSTGTMYYRYGPWRWVGGGVSSKATCYSGARVTNGIALFG